MLWCAEPGLVVQIIKKSAEEEERCTHFCSVEAAIGGEIGVGAPSSDGFLPGWVLLQNGLESSLWFWGADTEPDIYCWCCEEAPLQLPSND